MLYVFPPLFILGAWVWGCRESDRPLILFFACACSVAFVPTLYLALETATELAKGSAYALAVMATSSCAMLLRIHSDPDDGGERVDREPPDDPSGDDPSPFPVDWGDFERRYWAEVKRRDRERIPA